MDATEDVADYLKRHGLVLCTAESCTGGLIAAKVADVKGAGSVLDCAFVVYSPDAKQRLLGVDADILERFNLTSEPVAKAMATGAVVRSAATVAVSNTGLADQGDGEIPPGTQCFGWAFQLGDDPDAEVLVYTETRRFDGDRTAVREAAADYALQRIAHYHRLSAGERP